MTTLRWYILCGNDITKLYWLAHKSVFLLNGFAWHFFYLSSQHNVLFYLDLRAIALRAVECDARSGARCKGKSLTVAYARIKWQTASRAIHYPSEICKSSNGVKKQHLLLLSLWGAWMKLLSSPWLMLNLTLSWWNSCIWICLTAPGSLV